MKFTLENIKRMIKQNNGNLDLMYSKITDLPEGLVVPGSLDLSFSNITSLPKDLVVGYSIDLSYTPIKKLPSNLTVGTWLDLSCTEIENLPENLTVGCEIYLYNTQINSLPETFKLGGEIFGTMFNHSGYKWLKNKDYVPGNYLYVDGILTHVKNCIKVNDYLLYVGKIKGKNILSDGKNYVQCKTLKEGIVDILYKKAKSLGVEQYRNLTKESIICLDEAIVMYRIITGSYKQEIENFMLSQEVVKKKYTISEIINLTRGRFGSEQFAKFFES